MTLIVGARSRAVSLTTIGALALAACGGGEGSPTSSSASTAAAAVATSDPRSQAMAVTTTAGSTLVLRARSSMAANIGPMVEIRVGGVLIGSVEVRASALTDYSFPVGAIDAGTQIDVTYTNDAVVNGQDRNLFVEYLKVNGVTVAPGDSSVFYDRGVGTAAFDGRDVIAGQSGLYWAGSLRVKAPAALATALASTVTTPLDAWRLADQATFGATETLLADIQQQGPAKWVAAQLSLSNSHYTLGKGDDLHKLTSTMAFCQQPAYQSATCFQDWQSSIPLVWDFYRNATRQPDQLRQRVALALQQILVVSDLGVSGTYGLRNYQNTLLDNALGNYRQVLKKVALSPLMGDYLSQVNNDKAAPNENLGRELLQLFAIGTCELNLDGSLKGAVCTPTYNNDTVRNYAYALTGWTYPAGGISPAGCWPQGTNCRYYGGDMVAVASRHDTTERTLLAGVTVPSGSTAASALESVLDSLMTHPNTAPFISHQLIQHLVTSNPSAAYVQRVASAFTSGRFASAGLSFGAGQRGDLSATVAAILLDSEARNPAPARSAGRLREPALAMAGVIRALNGNTDGDALGYWWGGALRQQLFRAPSVFNFYPPNFPVPGSALVAPAFGIHNANTALARLNFLTYLVYSGGSVSTSAVQSGSGTSVTLTAFESSAGEASVLVDRLSQLAVGKPLSSPTREQIIAAVETIIPQSYAAWKTDRVRQAAYLVFAAPEYHISR